MHAVGVDLGGTKTAAGVVSAAGEVLFSETIPTLNRDGGAAILDATAALVIALIGRAQKEGLAVAGVGVGSAGVIDSARGVVVSATDAIRGWAGTALTEGLAARLGLPASSVRAVNDVHAHALGEAWTGAAAGTASSLLVAFGTGVGGSFVVDGRPALDTGMPAAMWGISPHRTRITGAWPSHAFAADQGTSKRSPPARHSWRPTSGWAARHPPAMPGVCSPLPARATPLPPGPSAPPPRLQARRWGGLANILDPEIVVVSGGLSDAGEPWWEPMRVALQAELLPALGDLPVVPAALGNAAALVGAARLILTPLHTSQESTP